jgi:hypothetical protein
LRTSATRTYAEVETVADCGSDEALELAPRDGHIAAEIHFARATDFQASNVLG